MFIALEGIDGAGKTTAVRAAGDLLRAGGYRVTAFSKQCPAVTDPYVQQHLRALGDMIWSHPPDDPYYRLGDYHWIHLIAAYLSAVDRCVVSPLVAQGQIVLVDNWIHKSLARIHLNPRLDRAVAERLFHTVATPDLVILLNAEPGIVAGRKGSISAVEAGVTHPDATIDRERFVDYQTRLGDQLRSFATQASWSIVDVGHRDQASVARSIATAVVAAVARRPAQSTA